ncbi:MAG TPA: hypothetical protein VG820_05480 [Fimbriimonadaceae bacterium]|nr:hypothetical protein [Fimbriimonadaceae bacterium]
MGAARDFKSWANKQAAPATIAILALMIASSIFWWSVHQKGIQGLMMTSEWTSSPWQLVTYSFAYEPLSNALNLMFFTVLLIWTFFAGSFVEREIGAVRFVLLWIVTGAIPALLMGLWGTIANYKFAIGGPFLAVDGITVAWCARNASSSLYLYGVIPVMGKWLAWISAASIFFLYGAGQPIFGILAAVPLILPWLYASNRLPNIPYRAGDSTSSGKIRRENLKAHERQGNKYFDDVRRREQERAEREKLRKLFEDSMKDDGGEK